MNSSNYCPASSETAREREVSGKSVDLERKLAERTEALEQTTVALREATKQICELNREAVGIASREHQKIGAFLHDNIGQLLTGIGFLSQSLEQRLRARGAPECDVAEEIRVLAVQAISETRYLSRGYFAGSIKSHGLGYALAELADSVKKTYGVKCQFSETASLPAFSSIVAMHLYRIVQEGINNAIKHGEASEILISLDVSGDRGTLRIYNDGSDYTQKSGHDGVGVIIMHRRASEMGGTISIGSREQGVEVSCSFPCEKECWET